MTKHAFRIFIFGSLFALVIAFAGQTSAVAADLPETAEGTVRHVADGFLQHEPERIWVALPAGYQKDVNKLIGSFAQKVDAEIYDRGFQLVGKLGQLLESKKDLFLASQMLPEDFDREEAAANWDSLTGMISTIMASDLSRAETLANFDPEKFLATTGKSLLQQAEQVASAAGEDLFEDLRKLEIEVVESDEDSATLRLSGVESKEDGFYIRPVEELQMVRVEGRWVPRDLAEGWGKSIAEALSQIEQMSPEKMQAQKPQILATIGMVEGVFAQLNAAETTQQLDQALQMAMFSLMGIFMSSGLQGSPAQ